jgi:CRISPR system Cascade subunit CasB
MSGFIEWLEKLSEKDTKVRAVLRRSLAFDPGAFPPAYPYVEPFLKDLDISWRRGMFYLVAGLWAAHWRQDRTGIPMTIAKACAVFDTEKRSKLGQDERMRLSSTEKRFVSLLDADPDQLPNRLRQLMALLKDHAIDFDALLTSLLYWTSDQKSTQNRWARDFYRNMTHETETVPITEEENK